MTKWFPLNAKGNNSLQVKSCHSPKALPHGAIFSSHLKNMSIGSKTQELVMLKSISLISIIFGVAIEAANEKCDQKQLKAKPGSSDPGKSILIMYH